MREGGREKEGGRWRERTTIETEIECIGKVRKSDKQNGFRKLLKIAAPNELYALPNTHLAIIQHKANDAILATMTK